MNGAHRAPGRLQDLAHRAGAGLAAVVVAATGVAAVNLLHPVHLASGSPVVARPAGSRTQRARPPERSPEGGGPRSVLVLNSSPVSEAAIEAASTLTAHGWRLLGVGQVAARLAGTTVFYAPGDPALRLEARDLQETLPGVRAISVMPSWLSGSAPLVVVLASVAPPS